MLDKQQQAAIGFAYIIENLQTCSPFGEELARHTHAYPCEENARLCRELENVRLLAETIRSDAAREALSAAERALMQLKDVRRSVARSREMTLTDVEFFEIKRFLIKLDALAEAFSKIPCGERLNEIDIHPMPHALSIVDPDGMRAMTFRVSDSASAELAKNSAPSANGLTPNCAEILSRGGMRLKRKELCLPQGRRAKNCASARR